MSEHEWKPGDVAMVKAHIGHQETLVLRGWDGRWYGGDGIYRLVSDARPLVVIDPEDREAVERLVRLFWDNGNDDCDDPPAMQAALREFANPTPSEPTDPKAVVTDRRENAWRLLADGDWVCTFGPDCGEYLDWSGLVGRGPLEVEIP